MAGTACRVAWPGSRSASQGRRQNSGKAPTLVGVNVAAPGNKTRLVDGTSFAAPFVAAAYAMSLDPATHTDEIERSLSASARDLGTPGQDPIYGWGLIRDGYIFQINCLWCSRGSKK